MIEIGYSEDFCTITFAREKKKNALNKEMYIRLVETFEEATESKKVKSVIIRGKGDYFCAGHDIEEFITKPKEFNIHHPLLKFLGYLENFPKILIFVLDGHAVGIGAAMLLHGDIIIARKNLEISMPSIEMGLCAEAGSSQLLERIIGKPLAREMLLLGKKIKTDRLKGTLINELTNNLAQTNAMLTLVRKQISAIPMSGILQNKNLMYHRAEPLSKTMEREVQAFSFLLQSPETQKFINQKITNIKDNSK